MCVLLYNYDAVVSGSVAMSTCIYHSMSSVLIPHFRADLGGGYGCPVVGTVLGCVDGGVWNLFVFCKMSYFEMLMHSQ